MITTAVHVNSNASNRVIDFRTPTVDFVLKSVTSWLAIITALSLLHIMQ